MIVGGVTNREEVRVLFVFHPTPASASCTVAAKKAALHSVNVLRWTGPLTEWHVGRSDPEHKE